MLSDFFQEQHTITLVGCAVQYFLCSTMGMSESCLMTAMAYDRYAAICNPLLYSSVMSPKLCVGMVLGSYMAGLSASISQVCAMFQLHFCGPNVIHHFFCDMPQLLVLSCTDTFFVQLLTAVLTIFYGIINVLVIIVSYCYIVISIMKITTAKGRSKSFNTCASHLTAVSLFYTSERKRPMRWNMPLDRNKCILLACSQDAGRLFQKQKSISFVGCTMQYFFFSSLGLTECCLLAAMAYDRYAAICNPLLYTAIKSPTLCVQMVAGSCITGFLGPFIQLCALVQLHFCGPNVINHFFCDLPQLRILSCSDTFFFQIMTSVLTVIFGLTSVLIIMISYGYIVATILRITSAEGRTKAFNTCTSHLMAVTLFFGSGAFVYLRPGSDDSLSQDKLASVVYTVIIPMLNPLIYSLRNKEIRDALSRWKKRMLSWNHYEVHFRA
ncbi:Olfactory Receptor 5An1 [Manis pentadactyla]|nr:Olfactory Receptor 5An1 [Manis pentadactyla]